MKGRPPKHLALVTTRMTKADRDVRSKGEAALKARQQIKKSPEVKNDKVASRYFNRLISLYKEIDMVDALCENTINRYCVMLSRLAGADALCASFAVAMDELNERKSEMEYTDYLAQLSVLTQSILGSERMAAKLRDQLLSIERESLLTLLGKLRAVPKKQVKPYETGGLAAYREKYGGMSG